MQHRCEARTRSVKEPKHRSDLTAFEIKTNRTTHNRSWMRVTRKKCTHEPGAPTAFALTVEYGKTKAATDPRGARLREANAPGLRVRKNEISLHWVWRVKVLGERTARLRPR
jgi:hypothetical protein